MFQQDGQSDQHFFLHLLMNVRYVVPMVEEWKLIMTLTDTPLDAFTKITFDMAIHLFIKT